jgi:hypothetical protein
MISMGFEHILELDNCFIPRSFVQWVGDNIIHKEDKIQIGCKSILLYPQAVEDTLGTPSGNLPIDGDEEAGKAAFLELFGLSEVPSNSFFGKKILAKEL